MSEAPGGIHTAVGFCICYSMSGLNTLGTGNVAYHFLQQDTSVFCEFDLHTASI